MPYPRSSAGLETTFRFSVLQATTPSSINSGYPPARELKIFNSPCNRAGTLRLGPSKQEPKSQNHHNSQKQAHGKKKKSEDQRSEISALPQKSLIRPGACKQQRSLSASDNAKPPSVLIQAKSYLPLLAKPHQFLLVFLCYSSRTLPLSIFCLNSGKNLVF